MGFVTMGKYYGVIVGDPTQSYHGPNTVTSMWGPNTGGNNMCTVIMGK